MINSTWQAINLQFSFQYLDDILKNLTADDIRCLLITEDELARSAPLERIFPSAQSHKYLQYIESPRYYNRLLDAWEYRYGGNRREKGIALIRKFCEDKVHLTVPPQPAKKVNEFLDFNFCDILSITPVLWFVFHSTLFLFIHITTTTKIIPLSPPHDSQLFLIFEIFLKNSKKE